MLDIILDAFFDALKILPFLFLIYLLMEVIESAKNKEKIEKALGSKYAPLIASGLGVIPECGFSVMCAKLYSCGMITLGTLFTAFISTSDEGLIVLISEGAEIKDVLLLMGIKVVYAIVIGVLVNALMSKYNVKHVCPDNGDCIECGKHNEKKIGKYLLHPLKHALTTFLFILVINAIIGIVAYLIGEEKIYYFMNTKKGLQPIICSLIGLIPNCGSSIFLAEGFVNGIIGFSGLISGLCANAGIGLLIILKDKTVIRKGLLIIPLLYCFSIILGYLTILI